MKNLDIGRRDFIKTSGIVAGATLLGGCSPQKNNQNQKRPNILLIMNDDMGYSDIGCYGGEIRTPNIDRLASNGLKFKQFYNTARCCPTRASLLTGLYPHQAGIGHMVDDAGFPSYRGDLSPNSVTIAEAMRGAGYATYMSGKWHVTKHLGQWTGDKQLMSKHNFPIQRGFDSFYGTIIGCGSFFDPVTLTRGNDPIAPETNDYYYTDAITENAIKDITEHRSKKPDTPFFNYVAYTAPHWPMHALPEDIAKYKGIYDKGRDTLRNERYERMISMGIIDPQWKLTDRDSKVPSWDDTDNKEWEIRRMEVYAAMIDRMDAGIGKIINTLEKLGELENTVIMFLADNGGCAEELSEAWAHQLFIPEATRDGRPMKVGNNPAVLPGPEDTYQSYGVPWANCSNTPFRLYKHWVHEGGISTPFIIHWPGKIADKGGWREQPCHLVDIMATCVDISGGKYPVEREGNPVTPMEGVSIAPALENKQLDHEAIYWEHEGNRAVRKDNWKLVSKYPGNWELFDIETDRTETNDLASKNPEKVKELSELWEPWAEKCDVQNWEDVKKGVLEFGKKYNNRYAPGQALKPRAD